MGGKTWETKEESIHANSTSLKLLVDGNELSNLMANGVQINFKPNKRVAIQHCTTPSQGQCQQPDFLFYFIFIFIFIFSILYSRTKRRIRVVKLLTREFLVNLISVRPYLQFIVQCNKF